MAYFSLVILMVLLPKPVRFTLAGYPNPARGFLRLRFGLPVNSQVDLAVFDANGRRVRTLLRAGAPRGTHELAWDGSDTRGRATANGVYFCRLVAGGNAIRTRKLVLVR